MIRIEAPSRGELSTLTGSALRYAASAQAPATERAHRSDLAHFTAWCGVVSVASLPASPATLAAYLAHLADTGSKVSTIMRRLSSISKAHQTAGLPNPTRDEAVRLVVAGIKRDLGTAPGKAAPLMTGDVRCLVAACPDTLSGLRDRALLLVGFAGGFRRSELVGLAFGDLEPTVDGLVIHLRRSKTDQEGEGREVEIAYGKNLETCPVRTLNRWLREAGISTGPLFRAVNKGGRAGPVALAGYDVVRIIRRTAELAGLDPTRFSGHSLRSGFASSAAAGEASERAIMAQTGHRSLVVARGYIRRGQRFRDPASARLGL